MHREVAATYLAAPTWLGCRTTTVVADLAAAPRTDRFAISLRPAQAPEDVLGVTVDIRITWPGLSERAAA